MTVSAYGVEGITGGGTGSVIEVRTAQEFQNACERRDIRKKADQNDSPRIIKIVGDIDLGVLANERPGDVLESVGKVEVRSNTTIFASGEGATLRHGVVEVHGAHNVIIRNLKFRDLWEPDPTGKYDRLGWDFVRIVNSGPQRSHHVWVDHCDFERAYDGALDITHGSDLVTVSWCRFGGTPDAPHKKVMLIGHSSSANAAASDTGRLNVTLHHNFFHDLDDRTPRARFGNVHCFNNVVVGAENATISVMKAVTLVEGCVYRDVRVATTFSHASDNIKNDRAGMLVVESSFNENPRSSASASRPAAEEDAEAEAPPSTASPSSTHPDASKKKDANREFELTHNFQGSVERSKLEFNAPTDWSWPDRHRLPYAYQVDPIGGVYELVSRFAGTGHLRDAEMLGSK